MLLFILGMLAGFVLTILGIVFLANITGPGVYDMPPDPTYHPAGWKDWHEARKGGDDQ